MKLILPAPTELNDIESADLCHFDDYKWFRDGEDVVQFIEDFLQTRREIADNIQQTLEFRLYDFDSDAMGLETMFAQGPSYAERRQVNTGSEYIRPRFSPCLSAGLSTRFSLRLQLYPDSGYSRVPGGCCTFRS